MIYVVKDYITRNKTFSYSSTFMTFHFNEYQRLCCYTVCISKCISVSDKYEKCRSNINWKKEFDANTNCRKICKHNTKEKTEKNKDIDSKSHTLHYKLSEFKIQYKI